MLRRRRPGPLAALACPDRLHRPRHGLFGKEAAAAAAGPSASKAILRRGRHASGPRPKVRRRRRHADVREPARHRRQGLRSGPAPRLPAQHGRRLDDARHGHVAERARLDQQHLPPHRRGQLQQLHELCGYGDRPGGPHRASCRARGQVRGLDGMGCTAQPHPALQGPVVDFRSASAGAASSSTTTSRVRPQQPSASSTSGSALPRARRSCARGRHRLDLGAGLPQHREGSVLHPKRHAYPGAVASGTCTSTTPPTTAR